MEFVDTDHLARSPLTKVALAAVDDVIIPQSLILGDFYRLFQDPTKNALFDHVMLPMSADRTLRAKVRKIVFTKVQSNQNQVNVTEGGVPSPFKPPKESCETMDKIVAILKQIVDKYPQYQELFWTASEHDTPPVVQHDFAETYCTAFKIVPDTALGLTMKWGAPLITMEENDPSWGVNRPTGLVHLKNELKFLSDSILGDS